MSTFILDFTSRKVSWWRSKKLPSWINELLPKYCRGVFSSTETFWWKQARSLRSLKASATLDEDFLLSSDWSNILLRIFVMQQIMPAPRLEMYNPSYGQRSHHLRVSCGIGLEGGPDEDRAEDLAIWEYSEFSLASLLFPPKIALQGLGVESETFLCTLHHFACILGVQTNRSVLSCQFPVISKSILVWLVGSGFPFSSKANHLVEELTILCHCV